MSISDIEALLPTDEELVEQGFEPEEDPERIAQDEADGLEDSLIVGE